MREIKIRGWDKFEKKMITWEMCLQEEKLIPEILLNHVRYEPMLYTGLVDKNGNEICESDILSTSNSNPEFDVWDRKTYGYTIVMWRKRRTCFRGTRWTWNNTSGENVHDLMFVEVVGNKYENPELLEARK
jgi:uncharacterized phage protein (TIGR01671 family)